MSKPEKTPNTCGQKFIRGILPATTQFDNPQWWKNPAETVDAMIEGLEMAWGIISNAGGGDWQKESPEWQEAAAKWRDRYFALEEYCSKIEGWENSEGKMKSGRTLYISKITPK